MMETDRLFVGPIPEIYDRYLGPLFFEPYANDLAARLAAHTPARVLEIAAGTGVATRALATALPATAEIVATDLNQPMVDFAAARTAAANIAWRQADAMRLPFDDGGFDAVVCQFGAMFFPNKVNAYREARRVLRPGGRFFFNVWDRIEENGLAHVLTEALALLFPDDPPRFLARTPHGYYDLDTIRDELWSAGFAEIAIETVEQSSQADSARDPAIGLCQGTPVRDEIEARAPGRLAEATDAASRAIAARFGAGPLAAKMQAHVVVAR